MPGLRDLNYTTNLGACRGRMDLYPNNQAHTVTLSGAAALPLKTNFMGTASYGVDSRMLPSCRLPLTVATVGTRPATCRDAALTPCRRSPKTASLATCARSWSMPPW